MSTHRPLLEQTADRRARARQRRRCAGQRRRPILRLGDRRWTARGAWLTSTWDQNAALHACGPAAAIIEEITGDWLARLLNLPAQVSFAFTTDAQQAHVTALAAARHHLWNGLRAMRISVVNWRTSDADVTRAITAVREALRTT